MKDSIFKTGKPSLQEKIWLILNIPEFWNKLNAMITNEPFIWPDGHKTFPHDTYPFIELDHKTRELRLLELISFSQKWRIKSYFIQPFVNGCVFVIVVEFLKFLFKHA